MLAGLISKLLCLGEPGGPRGGETANWWNQNTHIYQLRSLSYVGMLRGVSTVFQNLICIYMYHQRSLITGHHNKYKSEKVWNIVRITKLWHRDTDWANTVGKTVPIDLLNTGLPHTFNLWKTVSTKCNRAKCNKTRYHHCLHPTSKILVPKSSSGSEWQEVGSLGTIWRRPLPVSCLLSPFVLLYVACLVALADFKSIIGFKQFDFDWPLCLFLFFTFLEFGFHWASWIPKYILFLQLIKIATLIYLNTCLSPCSSPLGAPVTHVLVSWSPCSSLVLLISLCVSFWVVSTAMSSNSLFFCNV